ncbi:hypothetical protein DOTSEDRAFT_73825 [Dothistroma septosporum NZE10]|uniref:Uncharacterized protein n=1 Tax=Dothistroma septosporum (strain NZE10 / CBS 128990) TaxID=675120 RepID=N1PHC1_DOTSN|nr:hypothetical protein DOTSEDRAFT_73825 [Dothistroma septosporum NZE10]
MSERSTSKPDYRVHFLPEREDDDWTLPPTCTCGSLFCFGGKLCDTKGSGTPGYVDYEPDPWWKGCLVADASRSPGRD